MYVRIALRTSFVVFVHTCACQRTRLSVLLCRSSSSSMSCTMSDRRREQSRRRSVRPILRTFYSNRSFGVSCRPNVRRPCCTKCWSDTYKFIRAGSQAGGRRRSLWTIDNNDHGQFIVFVFVVVMAATVRPFLVIGRVRSIDRRPCAFDSSLMPSSEKCGAIRRSDQFRYGAAFANGRR
jgi:hypothetical protein